MLNICLVSSEVFAKTQKNKPTARVELAAFRCQVKQHAILKSLTLYPIELGGQLFDIVSYDISSELENCILTSPVISFLIQWTRYTNGSCFQKNLQTWQNPNKFLDPPFPSTNIIPTLFVF